MRRPAWTLPSPVKHHSAVLVQTSTVCDRSDRTALRRSLTTRFPNLVVDGRVLAIRVCCLHGEHDRVLSRSVAVLDLAGQFPFQLAAAIDRPPVPTTTALLRLW